jgi:2-oxo-4-hydroxy-4-carboxy-5-ureidoimidazoline decarboxylase
MSAADRAGFVARFGGVFEHSPWIAEAAFDAGLPADAETAQGLHRALCAALAAADDTRKLALLRAHPSLAGRLALAGGLTAASSAEQASAGLDRCTPEELARFRTLNTEYEAKFGFPFIMAVRGVARETVLAAFEQRIRNDRETEFATALAQVERIALLRLKELLP